MKYLGKFIFLILFLTIIGLFYLPPTVKSSQSPLNLANCDACGYCQGSSPPSNWEKCRNCLYPQLTGFQAIDNKTLEGLPTPDPEHHYTMLGCISTNPGQFTRQMTDFFFRITGGIAFLFLLYGASVLITSQADPEKLNHGKRIVYGSIVGLLFVLLSVFIFNFIANNILKLPGF